MSANWILLIVAAASSRERERARTRGRSRSEGRERYLFKRADRLDRAVLPFQLIFLFYFIAWKGSQSITLKTLSRYVTVFDTVVMDITAKSIGRAARLACYARAFFLKTSAGKKRV